MRLFTIGFTKKKAREFFGLLSDSGATALVDTRLRNRSQLAGFAKRDDLEFFLSEICDMHYRQELLLTPTEQALRDYQHGAVSWEQYAAEYARLLEGRQVEAVLSPADFNEAVLLCSEASPDRCHRRLAAEYLTSVFPTGHAIGLALDDGTELLIHIGIDTVGMKGDGFETLVKTGDTVVAGTPLIRFDVDKIRAAGLSPITPVIVLSNENATVAFD